MTPYKGIIRISCAGTTCKEKLTQPVAECVNCEHARLEVLDLDGKVIADSSKLKAQGTKPKTKKVQSSKVQGSKV